MQVVNAVCRSYLRAADRRCGRHRRDITGLLICPFANMRRLYTGACALLSFAGLTGSLTGVALTDWQAVMLQCG